MPKTHLKGAVFDLDGVVTDTAKLHAESWEQMFNDFLMDYSEREGKPFLPFDPSDDYKQYVDGKPRYAGVKSFLEARGILLDYGSPEDDPGKETICGLGNRKNELFQKVLKEKGPDVYESTVEFIGKLKELGVAVGVASSSKNCQTVLEMAGLEELFTVRVDGVVSAELGLKGKPDADIFTTAAERLGLYPPDCMVIEDAVSGVQAGRNGNFGLVLGVARTGNGELLQRFGADKVVSDLSEFTMEDIDRWFHHGLEADGWNLTYIGHDPGDDKLRATLLTVGNGYLGTRGVFDSESASYHYYPGTYIAGVFNNAPSIVGDREIYNNDFVNCPNWLLVEFKIGSGDYLSPLSMDILSFAQNLDMRRGMAEWRIVCRDKLGRITRVHTRRIASMADPHLCALQYDITPLNYTDRITIRSSIDGNVINDGVPRYRQLTSKHLELVDAGRRNDGISLHVQTIHSRYQIVMNAKTALFEDGKSVAVTKDVEKDQAKISETFCFEVDESRTYTLEKLVSVHTSLDQGVARPQEAAARSLDRAKSFKSLFARHEREWQKLWDRADIQIDGDRFTQKVARLHIYHLLVTASPNNTDIDAGMPARGLHGEAYRGHIFWDELYIMPFFDLHFPRIAKSLLMYRYRRIDAAMEYAEANGYEGAMYPWQTADGGGEETQEVHYNPESGRWGPDLSRRQRHVSIAVFYNVWKYIANTSDEQFMREAGSEMLIEIARFWASIAEKGDDGRYHISGVMGPDEFHEKLPNTDEPGLTDNAYTNIMVVWLMEKVLEMIEKLPKKQLDYIKKEYDFDIAETEKWRAMTEKMNVIITDEGIISQFDGYMDLDELDWDYYREKYYSIARMDRILKANNDSPDHYKVAKQADVLMTWYVLAPEEVARILRQLGYPVEDEIELLRRNYEYYEPRTSHGSTLSKVVHAVVASYTHQADAVWDWFTEAMRSDIYDTQGGTTVEGIHCGVMAGTIDVIRRYFAGININDHGQIVVEPDLPVHWKSLTLKLKYRKVWYDFRFNHDQVSVSVAGNGNKPTDIIVCGKELDIRSGQEKTCELKQPEGN